MATVVADLRAEYVTREANAVLPTVVHLLRTVCGLHTPPVRIIATTWWHMITIAIEAELAAADLRIGRLTRWRDLAGEARHMRRSAATARVEPGGVLVLLRARSMRTPEDLVATLTHELVHAAQLAHPSRREARLAEIRHNLGRRRGPQRMSKWEAGEANRRIEREEAQAYRYEQAVVERWNRYRPRVTTAVRLNADIVFGAQRAIATPED